jgi:hypothetical protein
VAGPKWVRRAAHEGSMRRILEMPFDFPKGMPTRAAERPFISMKALSTGRSSPTQLSRQSKSGHAEIAREFAARANHAAESVNTPNAYR